MSVAIAELGTNFKELLMGSVKFQDGNRVIVSQAFLLNQALPFPPPPPPPKKKKKNKFDTKNTMGWV